MRPVVVVVGEVFVQQPAQLCLVDDEGPVELLAAQRADHPFAHRVRARRVRWCRDDLDVRGGEDGVERCGELRVPVGYEVAQVGEPLVQVEEQVCGPAGSPTPRSDGRSRRPGALFGRPTR
jgi:hypothetical protein